MALGKKTVAGAIKSLTNIQNDLKEIAKAKTVEITAFNTKKIEIEKRIKTAEKEKERGNTIYTNITKLLGG